jgi:DNA polymerase III epsilon subunit family exonuclease
LDYLIKGKLRNTYYAHNKFREPSPSVQCIVKNANNKYQAIEEARRSLSKSFGRFTTIDSVMVVDSFYECGLSDVDFERPWYESKIVAFDLETTGIKPDEDVIVEIGFSTYDASKKDFVDPVSYLVNEGVPIPPAASKVNNITNKMLEGCPSFKEAAGDILGHIRDADILIAHNRGFDINFLLNAIKRSEIEFLMPPVVCSMELAIQTSLGQKNNKLETLIELLNIPKGSSHRAGYDARACGLVFMELARKNKYFHRPCSLGQFLNYFDDKTWEFEKMQVEMFYENSGL